MRRRRRLNPGLLLKRRRWIRRAVTAVLLVITGIVAVDRIGVVRSGGGDHGLFDQRTFVVSRVVDGDTVQIEGPGGAREKVRLIGIDAPEMRYDTPDPPEHWAREATDALQRTVEGRRVTLKLEPLEARDRYSRLLAYLYLDDSRHVNLEMIEHGHAYAHRRFGHSYRSQFEQAEARARRKGSGLWQEVRVEQMPPWRQRWLAEQN